MNIVNFQEQQEKTDHSLLRGQYAEMTIRIATKFTMWKQ